MVGSSINESQKINLGNHIAKDEKHIPSPLIKLPKECDKLSKSQRFLACQLKEKNMKHFVNFFFFVDN